MTARTDAAAAVRQAKLLRTLIQRDGIARVRTLREAGHSRRTLDRALAEGRLIRACNGWVAVPAADAGLVAAAQGGVVLTCVTLASRLELFVLDTDDTPHVAAPPHAGRVAQARTHVHWAQPVVPRHPDQLLDAVENMLALVATCRPYEQALVVWESAFRKKLVEPHALARLALPPAGRRLLEDAGIYSDSGLETVVVPRLRWLGLPMRRQIWIHGHRVDLLIGDRLVLQIDGGTHVGAQREQDIAHDAALTLMGYHVIRVGYSQVIHRWHEVQDLIMRAVAQRLHLPAAA
jgi:very-short-patch-repair endonuclease